MEKGPLEGPFFGGSVVETILQLGLILICIWITYTDMRERRISNKLMIPAFFILCVIRIWEPSYYVGLIPALSLFLIWWVNPNFLSEGDIKLFAVIGLVFGLLGTISVFFWMLTAAIFFRIGYRWFIGKSLLRIPMGPFILAGMLFYMLLKTW